MRFPYVTVKQRDFLVFHDFDDVVVFSRAVPSILWVHWVHIRALSVDINASGTFRGSLKGLAIAISTCDSEKLVIFLFSTILTMF